jgi:type II secretory pathway pseudopilin PulG
MVEMVGVLAVIAILASLLTPKIFSSINEARLNAAVGSLDALKAATVSYYSKNGSLPLTPSAPFFDKKLVTAEFLERPFECKIGTNSLVQGVSGATAGPNAAGTTYYKLDGDTVFTATSDTVIQCVLSGVPIADALELSKQIDGTLLSVTTDAGKKDGIGRVVYDYVTEASIGKVYIYIGHR